MALFGGLGAAFQEAILIGVMVVVSVLLVLLGVEHYQLTSLRKDYTSLQGTYAACAASNVQFKSAVEAQNKAIAEIKTAADIKMAEQKALGDRRLAAAKQKAAGEYQAALSRMAAPPVDPKDLCGSAQKSNAAYLKEQR